MYICRDKTRGINEARRATNLALDPAKKETSAPMSGTMIINDIAFAIMPGPPP
jgi:hypothetical protein